MYIILTLLNLITPSTFHIHIISQMYMKYQENYLINMYKKLYISKFLAIL